MKIYNIGCTTGVFDLFHIGHLNLLSRAKEMCNYLIVGVSTDELVLEYKGHYPIIPFEDRCKIVSAIKYVDKVVPQTTLNKIDLLDKYKFDVMFHGSDWKGSKLYDSIEKLFNERGVSLEYLPYTKDISTSNIAQMLKEKR